jgi:PPK2 family polyphosphate:nucleotide phosphotransferase
MADLSSLLVKPGKKLDLAARPTDAGAAVDAGIGDKDAAAKVLASAIERLSDLQLKLHASARYAVLIVLQGMDASGKDGIIRRLAGGFNPQGCEVTSFKAPTADELQHDFLWRCHARVPRRGRIGLFNRSHYEDVLIQRVHPEIVVKANLPGIESVKDVGEAFWESRYEQIRAFESSLASNGTVIVKCFLHISRKEQKERLLERIDEPEKNWKLELGDVVERGFWDQYQDAYERALAATSTAEAPWYVIPADKKWMARAAVAEIVAQAMGRLDLSLPTLTATAREELKEARKELAAERD